jgi:nucleoside-diphosphate-sugar epimerase
MNKVLITGASGFIGRHCLPLLLEQGYEIHSISRYPLSIDPAIHWHQIDLLDRLNVTQLMAQIKPSHLLHLAWYAVPGTYWTALENFKWVQASLDLLQSFKEYGGERVVMAGSCAEYDWQYGYCDESITPLNPKSPYGSCKHSLSLMLDAFCKQVDISAAWGRIFWLYGQFEDPNRLVSSVIKSLLSKTTAQCSAGNQIRDFLYVEDVANALVQILGSNLTGAINIGSGMPISIRTLVEYIGTMLDRIDLLQFSPQNDLHQEAPLVVANVRRLRSELLWTPKFSLQQGIELSIEFWKQEMSIL